LRITIKGYPKLSSTVGYVGILRKYLRFSASLMILLDIISFSASNSKSVVWAAISKESEKTSKYMRKRARKYLSSVEKAAGKRS
jgi:hypothetical protein